MNSERFRNSFVVDSFLSLEYTYDESNYVIIRYPYEHTSSWLPGSKLGPNSIIEASKYLDTFDLETGDVPAEVGIYTLPEIEPKVDPLEALKEVEELVDGVLRDNKVPVLLGGEHTVSIGAARAAKRWGAEAFISLDAHMDFYESYEGSNYSHACTSKRISEFMRVAVIGVRTADWEEYENSRGSIIVLREELDTWKDKLSDLLGKRVHLSVDLDVMDPSVLPCLGTPEPDGLTWRETVSTVKGIIENFKVVSMDFVEFRPCPHMGADSLAVAKLIYKTIAYHSRRRRGNLGL